jgi:hypothetical protein
MHSCVSQFKDQAPSRTVNEGEEEEEETDLPGRWPCSLLFLITLGLEMRDKKVYEP